MGDDGRDEHPYRVERVGGRYRVAGPGLGDRIGLAADDEQSLRLAAGLMNLAWQERGRTARELAATGAGAC